MSTVLRLARHWECGQCTTINGPGVVFCQRCGRLAGAIEEDLLVHEEFLVLDGLKALGASDEETAHRCFRLATEQNGQSRVAWYWRARTGETVDEVVSCLEQLVALDPSDEQATADLEQARARKQREEALARAQAEAEANRLRPAGPTARQRLLAAARRVALEMAAVLSFVLGLFWLRPAVLDALRIAGIRGATAVLPAMQFPSVWLSVPGALTPPLPGTIAVLEVVTVVGGVWFLWLAFALLGDPRRARLLGIVSGVLALVAGRFVVSNVGWYLLVAGALLVLSLAGKRA